MKRPKSYAKELGASEAVDLGRNVSGPVEWLGMAALVRERLQSSGGRPTDPAWDTKRLVPFRLATWRRLQHEAAKLSSHGRKVGPAQLAALLIESHLGPD